MSDEPTQFAPHEALAETTKPSLILRLVKLSIAAFVFFLLVSISLYLYIIKLNKAPEHFPHNEVIIIEPGTDVRRITEILEEQNVVRSKALLYYTLVFLHDPTTIKASAYVFESPLRTTEVAKRLAEGDFDTNLVRFTHFEGERATKIATRAEQILPNFNAETFIALAEPSEGKLFPDTYFLPPTYTEADLLKLMLRTFDEKTASLTTQIEAHSLTLDEILVLASIIEREANNEESMKLVSSVLQNRLEINMALQADASIEYILDKPLAELTPEDLEIDSPYNTYLYPGLPPTPIGNPGLDAIKAVLEPTDSDYFYYITDENGEFHFSRNYQEHLRNIEKYLR